MLSCKKTEPNEDVLETEPLKLIITTNIRLRRASECGQEGDISCGEEVGHCGWVSNEQGGGQKDRLLGEGGRAARQAHSLGDMTWDSWPVLFLYKETNTQADYNIQKPIGINPAIAPPPSHGFWKTTIKRHGGLPENSFFVRIFWGSYLATVISLHWCAPEPNSSLSGSIWRDGITRYIFLCLKLFELSRRIPQKIITIFDVLDDRGLFNVYDVRRGFDDDIHDIAWYSRLPIRSKKIYHPSCSSSVGTYVLLPICGHH
jgi:hypothetical protein